MPGVCNALVPAEAFPRACVHQGHAGIPWRSSLGKGAMRPGEFSVISAKKKPRSEFSSAAQRDCLANALCWVSQGNSAGVKINKVPGSRGGEQGGGGRGELVPSL